MRLATNSVVQVLGTGATSVIGLVTFIAVARSLGPSAYGDLTAAMVFLYVPSVLADVGLSAAVVKEISARPERSVASLGASLPLRAGLAVGLIGAAVVIGTAMPFNDRTHFAILVGSIGAFFTVMNLSVLPVLQARLKMHWAVAATVTGRLVGLGLVLGALAAGLGFNGVVWATVIGLALTFVLSLLAVARFVPIRPAIDVGYWRRLVREAAVLGIALAVGDLYMRFDTILLALLKPAREVGLYGAAYKFIDLAVVVSAAAGTSLFPTLAQFLGRGDRRVGTLMQKSFDVMLAASVPLLIVGVALAPLIVRLTAGPGFEDAAGALQLLAPTVIAAFLQTPLIRLMMASGQYRMLLMTTGAMLTVNIALNLALIPPYGFKAAAVINSITGLAGLALQATVVARRLDFAPSLGYLRVVGPAAGAMVGVVTLLPGPELVTAALGAALYTAIVIVAPGVVREIVLRFAAEARPRSSLS